jgi:hypothetical protein
LDLYNRMPKIEIGSISRFVAPHMPLDMAILGSIYLGFALRVSRLAHDPHSRKFRRRALTVVCRSFSINAPLASNTVSAHVQDRIPGLRFSYRASSLFVHCYMHGKKKNLKKDTVRHGRKL